MEFIGSSIRFGWETFKKRPWFFMGVALLVAIVSGIVSAIVSAFGEEGAGAFAGAAINIVLSTLIGMGTTAFFLKAHDAPEAVQSNELWHPKNFWKYLAASLLAGVIVVCGLILLIVPGIILALMFMFACYIVIDKGTGPVEALKESRRITRGSRWQLLGFILALVGINILGFVCLIVGLLVSIPVSSLAFVHVYRTLTAKAGAPVPTV